MKAMATLLLAGVFTLMLSTACSKNKGDDRPAYKREYFNCYMNGEYWTMDQTGGNLQCKDLYATYVEDSATNGNNPTGFLLIHAKDCKTKNSLGFSLENVFTAESLNIKEHALSCIYKDWENVVENSDSYRYGSILNGTLIINELRPQQYHDAISPGGTPYVDVTPGWIEGTFEMQLMNHQNDTVKITKGKFGAKL